LLLVCWLLFDSPTHFLQVQEDVLLQAVSTASIQFPPEEMQVLSLISSDAGREFHPRNPLWQTIMKLKRQKVLMQKGTKKPTFYLSDPFFAAVVSAQQTDTVVETLIPQLRGRGLESLIQPMLPEILRRFSLGHLVRPQFSLLSSASSPHSLSLSEQEGGIRPTRTGSLVLQCRRLRKRCHLGQALPKWSRRGDIYQHQQAYEEGKQCHSIRRQSRLHLVRGFENPNTSRERGESQADRWALPQSCACPECGTGVR
jgi:hypothetical protein